MCRSSSYRTNSQLYYPVSNDDSRLPCKERVIGVIVNGVSKAYPINYFSTSIEIINDDIDNVHVVVAGSAGSNFAVAFGRTLLMEQF